jgi:hypothetical protein
MNRCFPRDHSLFPTAQSVVKPEALQTLARRITALEVAKPLEWA